MNLSRLAAGTAYSLRTAYVFPVDCPPIVNGVVRIQDDCIVEVGDQADADTIDLNDLIGNQQLGDLALTPGLINCHTHLEFSDLASPLGDPGSSLPDWIRQVLLRRRSADNESAQLAIDQGLRESRGFGVAALGEISTHSGVLAGLNPDVVSFVEVLGLRREDFSAKLAAAVQQLDMLSLTGRAPGISPHAPYTVPWELLVSLIVLAKDRAAPVAMHLAESEEELELLAFARGAFRTLLEDRGLWRADLFSVPRTPLDYLEALSAAERTLVIHGNYLNDAELALLGQKRDRMSLVFCPRTHAYFRHKRYPLDTALSRGVRVALGTDSRASNPDLNLWAEAQFAAANFPNIDPAAFLRMATLDGAEALGVQKRFGTIAAGKLAKLAVIPLASRKADPHERLLAGGSPFELNLTEVPRR